MKKGSGMILALAMMASAAQAKVPTWDWQLSKVDMSLPRHVSVIDLEPEMVTKADVAALKAASIYTIAYISVGTVEDWRGDADAFPAQVVGKKYGEWPGENFLDIRRHDVLMPLMRKRFEAVKAKGFDAVEPDNLDLHINETGFDISGEDVVAYTRALTQLAHSMGLEIGQKNVPDLTESLVPYLDFAVTESCFQDNWCNDMLPYIAAGKHVFDAEYSDRTINWSAACVQAKTLGISMILKDRDLTGLAKKFCQ